jgi:hypothetical protein
LTLAGEWADGIFARLGKRFLIPPHEPETQDRKIFRVLAPMSDHE